MATRRLPDRPDPKQNILLSKLEADDYKSLMGGAKLVDLKFRSLIQRQDAAVDAVYFPINSMASLIVTSDGKPQMEMAMIGNEGVVGASEILQSQRAMGLALVQIPGFAVRVAAETFRDHIRNRPRIEALVHRHFYALARQILHGAACNKLHSMEERCARWLLMTHDRAGQDSFPLTQEFLAHMLGVRRATVNVAIGMLKKAGFIQYVRGNLSVVDRQGLESASCECYQAIVNVYNSAMLDGGA